MASLRVSVPHRFDSVFRKRVDFVPEATSEALKLAFVFFFSRCSQFFHLFAGEVGVATGEEDEENGGKADDEAAVAARGFEVPVEDRLTGQGEEPDKCEEDRDAENSAEGEQNCRFPASLLKHRSTEWSVLL